MDSDRGAMKCICGSGKPCEDIYDGRGIYVTRVCDDCKEERLKGYRPEILNRYYKEEDVCERIEPDY